MHGVFTCRLLSGGAVAATLLLMIAYHFSNQRSPRTSLQVGASIATEILPKDGHTYFFSIGDFGVAACETAFKAGDVESAGGIGHRACLGDKQRIVAAAMDRLASRLQPSFILSLGDNFYVRGVKNLDDPQFRESFEDVYCQAGALSKIPWQISLGDHDHRGNVSAILGYGHRNAQWKCPSPYYSFDAPVPGGHKLINVVVTDSVGLEGAASEHHLPGRRFLEELSEEFAGRDAGERQWRWLDAALLGDDRVEDSEIIDGSEGPALALRIVVGHRPALSFVNRSRSDAEREVARRLRKVLASSSTSAPVLYLHGHDHAMQHSTEAGGSVHHVGNGVGGMNLHGFERGEEPELFRWGMSDVFGFIVHEVGPSSMALHFVDADSSTIVHTVNLPYASG